MAFGVYAVAEGEPSCRVYVTVQAMEKTGAKGGTLRGSDGQRRHWCGVNFEYEPADLKEGNFTRTFPGEGAACLLCLSKRAE